MILVEFMGKLRTDKKLQGDYGELIFEHFSRQNNYAYISLEEIYNTLTPKNKLVFKYRYERIEVDLPEEIVEEVRTFCKPTNQKDKEPSFVFDYLTVSIRGCFAYDSEKDAHYQTRVPIKESFNWVEIKTGKSKLTKNQKEYKEKAKISVCVFRVDAKIEEEIGVSWDSKYHPGRYMVENVSLNDLNEEEELVPQYSKEEFMLMGFSEEEAEHRANN